MVALASVFKDEIQTRLRSLAAARNPLEREDGARSTAEDRRTAAHDLKEIGTEIAASVGILVADSALEHVRTSEDLIEVMLGMLSREHLFVLAPDRGVKIRARITANSHHGWYLERTLACTPYAIETLEEDALHAGPGACLDLTVPSGTSLPMIAWLEQCFARLARKGVRLRIRSVSVPGC